jgi:hypothetical protein
MTAVSRAAIDLESRTTYSRAAMIVMDTKFFDRRNGQRYLRSWRSLVVSIKPTGGWSSESS